MSTSPIVVGVELKRRSTGCLQRLYGISAAEEKMKVKDLSSLGHAQDEYVFRCLACRGTCVCKKHREEREAKERDGKDGKATKDGLEAFAKEAGVSTAEMAGIINDSATRTKGKQAKEKEAKPKEKVEKPPAVPRKKKVMEKKGPAAGTSLCVLAFYIPAADLFAQILPLLRPTNLPSRQNQWPLSISRLSLDLCSQSLRSPNMWRIQTCSTSRSVIPSSLSKPGCKLALPTA